MSFDWCIHGRCDDCPGIVQKFHVDNKNVAQVTGESICDCTCHEGE